MSHSQLAMELPKEDETTMSSKLLPDIQVWVLQSCCSSRTVVHPFKQNNLFIIWEPPLTAWMRRNCKMAISQWLSTRSASQHDIESLSFVAHL
jgi:hypothetical protein